MRGVKSISYKDLGNVRGYIMGIEQIIIIGSCIGALIFVIHEIFCPRGSLYLK